MAKASEARTVPLISLGVQGGLFFRRFFLPSFFFFSFCFALPSALFCLDAHAGSENQFAGYTSNAVLYLEQGTCTLSSARKPRSLNTMMRLTRHAVAPAVVGDWGLPDSRITLVSCFFFPFRVISLPTILVLPSHIPLAIRVPRKSHCTVPSLVLTNDAIAMSSVPDENKGTGSRSSSAWGGGRMRCWNWLRLPRARPKQRRQTENVFLSLFIWLSDAHQQGRVVSGRFCFSSSSSFLFSSSTILAAAGLLITVTCMRSESFSLHFLRHCA